MERKEEGVVTKIVIRRLRLADSTISTAEVGLEAIAEVLNAVEKHYNAGKTIFGEYLSEDGALSLIKVLEKGLKVKSGIP